MIHGSFILGQILFAGVTFFSVRPNRDAVTPLSPRMLTLVFGAAVVACVVALILRRRVPARSRSTSPDLFWTTASPKALHTWAPLEAAGLFALAQYFLTTDPIAALAAAIPIAMLAALNPWVLEHA
jgi:hypothetical protein